MYRNRTIIGSVAGFFAAASLATACTPEPGPEVIDTPPDVTEPGDPPALLELRPAPSFLYPTSEQVHGLACALNVSQMSNETLAGSLDQAWELLDTIDIGGREFASAEELQAFLVDASPFEAQLVALHFNMRLNGARIFGQYASFSSAQLTGGKFQGLSAKDLALKANKEESPELQEAIEALNDGFGGCVRGVGSSLRFAYFGPTNRDDDGDGVPAASDCDDDDLQVGALLYENDFSSDDGWFNTTPQLPEEWGWENGTTFSTGPRQQAMLGAPQNWDNVVVYATVSARGTHNPCGNDPGENACSGSDRWRAGILVRAEPDADQGEGLHGYRCALSSNAVNGCYEDGLFLQIGEFQDAAEDGVGSEDCAPPICTTNDAFDQLGRKNHSNAIADLSDGHTAELRFYAVGRDLYCEAEGPTGQIVATSAHDRSMTNGTIGLSTLNMNGEYDHIRVCEGYGTPEFALGQPDWEAALGEALNLADDSCARILMPMPFMFYGTNYSWLWINSNGNITFNGCNTWYTMPQLPHGLRAIIGPLYGDLNPALSGNVYWNLLGSTGNRRLVVTWSQVPEFNKGGRNTFQITLFEGSNNVQLAYDNLDTDGFQWNEPFPAMKVGMSSGNGRWVLSSEGSAIPGLNNSNICYVSDGLGNYDEISGYCP